MSDIIFKSIEIENNKYVCVKANSNNVCLTCDLKSYCDDVDNYDGIFDLCCKNPNTHHFKIKK